MIGFLNRHIRLRDRILAGYLLAAIVTLALVYLASQAFRGTVDDFNQFVSFGQQSRRDLLVASSLSEIQRQALIYTYVGHQSAADELGEIRLQLAAEIDRILRQEQPEIRSIAEIMRYRLQHYHDAFLLVREQREQQRKLINADFRNLATEAEQSVKNLISLSSHNPRQQLESQEILTAMLLVEKHAVRYFDTLDATHVAKTKQALARSLSGLEGLKNLASPSERALIGEAMDKLGHYQKSFIEAVQRTRGYLYLVNVVMAAEAFEMQYQAKKLSALVARQMSETEQSILSSIEQTGTLLLSAGIGLLALLITVSFVIGQSITRPIMLLAKAFEKLSRGDSISRIPDYRLPDEIGQLSRAAEAFREKNLETEGLLKQSLELAAELESKKREQECINREIQVLNDTLELKVKERTAQVEAASAAKSQFLAHMSHEIRTPMNAVLGLAQLLRKESLEPGHRAMVRHIREAGDILLHIINDVLDFSKIEAGELQIDTQPFTLKLLLDRIENLLRPVAENKNLMLIVAHPPYSLGTLLGDPMRLEQILINLVNNAIKFTKQGSVMVTVSPIVNLSGSELLRFEVIDTGIGIDPDAMSQLFQPFRQGDASITRRFGGTGLGLAISRRLVELMNGAMGVESEPDHGSTFWFEIPLILAGADAPLNKETDQDTVALPRHSLGGLNILAVDDNRINLLVLERALKQAEIRVVLAGDGLQALDILRKEPGRFDAVLMDVQMPVMDGLTATRAIRQEPALARLVVIALTAGVLPEERKAALAAGVNDFLAKPLDLQQLYDVLSPIAIARGNSSISGSA